MDVSGPFLQKELKRPIGTNDPLYGSFWKLVGLIPLIALEKEKGARLNMVLSRGEVILNGRQCRKRQLFQKMYEKQFSADNLCDPILAR